MERLTKTAGATAAWGGYLAVLAIVTAAAWVQDASGHVRFAAIATPSILATAAGCGVAVAALALFRSSLPLSLRWYGLVAGAYAALAFAGGALAATPLNDLLTRGSF